MRERDKALNYQIDQTTYYKLKHLAAIFMRNERQNHTLSPTALVNEAYLRLRVAEVMDPQYFLATAARDMRQILVDHARAKNARKRGDGIPAISLDEDLHASVSLDVDIIALNAALDKLAIADAVKVRIVEMRYFAGMTLAEIASELSIPVATVKRKWTMARTWLFRELSS